MPTVNDLLSRNSQTSQSHKPLPTFAENRSAGEGSPPIALINCCDSRVVPEEYLGLKPKGAILFCTIAGHPQGCWKDLVRSWLKGLGLQGLRMLWLFIMLVPPFLLLPLSLLTLSLVMIDCGSLIFTNDLIHEGIKKRNPGRNTENIIGTEFGAVSNRFILPLFFDLCHILLIEDKIVSSKASGMI
jgi:hypothetical protein